MSKILPDSKVTIIIEDDEVTKLVVNLAAKPEFAINQTYDLETGLPSENHLGFSCYALFDIDRNRHVEKQVISQKQYEDEIIDKARDILRARAQSQQTAGIDTTSICVVRGEN
ncbi:hypothetical protein SEA_MAKAI_86 [Arthrobacter phage Makai]|nr:hypothetical protein SEA_MAKAI_86 [Arthrobacter phage Makai]QPX62547.1 hypothetical protein SEA_TRUCKEE_83 [Arthrobacter phage Truckee]